MNRQRWQQAKEILDQASSLAPEARHAFVEQTCDDDEALRREITSLLAYHDSSAEALEHPAFDINAEDPSIGRRIGHYRIVRRLGRGGMGVVYLARREDDYTQQVAIKLIRRGLDSADKIARFHTERQILADLVHPSIARLLDGGTTEDGLPYLVMEWVEGEAIDSYCDRHRLGVRQRLILFRQILAAVAASHRHLVVHRDLKPDNILITADGTAKLIDFGIAKLLGPVESPASPIKPPPGSIHATATTLRRQPMSPRYASPEQIRGEPVTTASDIYSLGVLLYELLSGRSPYRADTAQGSGDLERLIRETAPPPSAAVSATADTSTPAATRQAIASARGTSERRLIRELRDELDAIVLKAMHKEPRRRYASVERLAADVGCYLKSLPVGARKNTPIYRLGKLARRRRLTLLLAGLGIAAAGFSSWTLVERQRATVEKARAAAIGAFVEDLFWSAHPDRMDGEALSVRELLARGAEHLGTGLQDQPLVRAELLEVVGRVNKDLGNWELAERQLAESLALQRWHAPGDDALIARRANELATVTQKSGNLDRAESLYREALTRLGGCRSALPDAPWIAGNLAWLRTQRGDFVEAERLIECLRDRQKLGLDGGDSALAGVLNKMAALRYRQGRLDDAEALFRQTLALRRTHHGPMHTQVANALNNLGKTLLVAGKVTAAESHLREALRIRRQQVGDEHPDTVNTTKNLAQVLVATGEIAAAEVMARRAVEILRLRSRVDPWRVADAESILGACLTELGRCSEAASLLTDKASQVEQATGEASPEAVAAHRRFARFEQRCRPPGSQP